MAYTSAPEVLVLHGVRILGMADTNAVARRYALDRDLVEELLLDDEARGLVRHSSFAGVSGWSLTERGRDEDERRLAEELSASDGRDAVVVGHGEFARLNARFLDAITRWQIRPAPGAPMAANDHGDWPWDERVLHSLAGLSRSLGPVGDRLSGALDRFGGYPERFAAALERVDHGERRWVDEPGVDSCHTVWFQLHEDLLSTLGLDRGADR
jgi:hypothetical protein